MFALSGDAVYQASRYGVLLVLVRMTSPSEVGTFALALAICSPISVLAALNLRSVQISDVRRNFELRDFVLLRLMTGAVSLLVITLIALFSWHIAFLPALLVLIGANQAVVGTREVFQSFIQKYERMGPYAISQMLSGLGALGGVWIAISRTGDVRWAVGAMLLVSCTALAAWDVPVTVRQRRLARDRPVQPSRQQRGGALLRLFLLSLPLAAAGVLTQLVETAPRYFIAGESGREELGYFAALAAVPAVGRVFVKAVGVSALPRLSRYFRDRSRAFVVLLSKLVLMCLAAGLSGFWLSVVWGRQILTLVLGEVYGGYQGLFVWLMVYGAFAYVAAILGYGLLATQWFRVQPFLLGMVAAISVLGAWFLVPRYGIDGAAIALVAARFFQVLAALMLIHRALRKASKSYRPSSR